MDPRPKVPQKIYMQNVSVTSTIVNETEEINARRTRPTMRSGPGHNAGVELVPQPSDSPLDPLNWPQWKKDIAFGSLVLGSATACILKTMLVTTNGVIATQLNCSYMAATALTGLPVIMGALSGILSTILAQRLGKRMIYLVSSIMMLLAALWNMHVFESYAQFMLSRLLQGIGWGAFESLVLLSVKDMFFVHERSRRIMMHNTSNIVFTWGTPILGGYLSQNNQSFRNEIMVANIIQAFSIALLILVTPETTYVRSYSPPNSTVTTSVSGPTAGAFKSYIKTLRLAPHSKSKFQLSSALLAVRALSAPSTIMTFLLTAPLLSTAFGIAHVLSLLFGSMPTFLFPARIGYLFIAPAAISLVAYSLASLAAYLRSRPPHHLTASKHLATAIPGIIMGVIGTLAFGLYTYDKLMVTKGEKTTLFTSLTQGQGLSLKVVSLLFGILVSGAVVANFASVMHLKYSVSSGSREEGDCVEGAHRTLQDILTGIFIIGMPLWIENGSGMLVGLKNNAIALAIVEVVIASSVGAVMWVKGDMIKKLDGRILKRGALPERDLALERTKTSGSFFDA